ncbi:hypothetical protein L3Q67_32350 [Saccharothrix sp. AJ9571]|nr:hypothetical protein L3Q67_32350 [Saccharothrix sp. AJ9571]
MARVRAIRTDGRWFLERRENGFGLWVHAAIRREIVREFPSAHPAEPPTRQFTDPSGRRRAEELAMAASELALDLCHAGEPTERSSLPTAMLHLWSLLGPVPDGARGFFLFSCWEHWTRRMSPARRVALAGLAGRRADAAHARAADLLDDERLREVWQRQLHLVTRIVDARPASNATPVNYLLFEHAKNNSAVLGLPEDTLALAASILRRLLNDPVSANSLLEFAPLPARL